MLRSGNSTYLINILGLTAGFVCCILINLWIYDELKFDKYYPNADRIYKVMTNDVSPNGIITSNAASIALGKQLKKDLPEIEYEVATTPPEWFKSFSINYKQNDAVKGLGNFAGKDFFNVFPRRFLEGSPNDVLLNTNSIVISTRLAKLLFKTTDGLIGKPITWSWLSVKKETFISGVFEDFPPNSTNRYDFVLPISSWMETINATENTTDVSDGPFNIYVTVTKGVNVQELNTKTTRFIKKHVQHSTKEVFLTKYADSYLYNVYDNGLQKGGRINQVRLFAFLALCIVIIACLNFVNLSTAKASEKLKQASIRKTLGAHRYQLIKGFLMESVGLSFLSLFLATLVVLILLPQFRLITNKAYLSWLNPGFVMSMLLIALVTGILSGSYPAIYLSRFKPLDALKGKIPGSANAVFIRKGLVFFQFVISVIFIAVVLVSIFQIRYIQSVKPGFDKDNLLYFEMTGKMQEDAADFLAEIVNVRGVSGASIIENTLILPPYTPRPGVYWNGQNADDNIRFHQTAIGFDGMTTLGIPLIAGRDFSREFNDSNSIIINEAAAKATAFLNPLGKKITVWGSEKTIVGVAKDFHFNSLHQRISPFIFRMEPQACLLVFVRLTAGSHSDAIAGIREKYNKVNKGAFFDYRFFHEDHTKQYAQDELVVSLSKYFAAFAIFVSCLGLFGLTMFSAEGKRKEVGVRKVLGASGFDVILLLSKDFSGIVCLSILVGIPASYLIAYTWLADFAYRIDLNAGYFIMAATFTFFVAMITFLIEAARAARLRPVDTLRNL